MKKIFFFFFIFIFSNNIFSQNKFKAGAKLGLVTSQVEGDTYSGYNKAGILIGGLINTNINEKWNFQFEILYAQKGSKHNPNHEIGDYTSYLLKLNYVEVPLLFQYRHKRFLFELGAGAGYLASYKEYDSFGEITGLRPFNDIEISANGGIEYNIYKGINMNWRFSRSINAIRAYSSGASFWWNPGQQNNVLEFALTYRFENNDKEE